MKTIRVYPPGCKTQRRANILYGNKTPASEWYLIEIPKRRRRGRRRASDRQAQPPAPAPVIPAELIDTVNEILTHEREPQ